MFLKFINGLSAAFYLPALAVVASACYVEMRDDSSKDGESGTQVEHYYMPPALHGEAEACEQSLPVPAAMNVGASIGSCFENPDYRWRTSCQSASCRETKVFAHYMLTDDLPGDYVVHVEAFANEHFQGTPAGSVRLANFMARRGEWREAQLFLEPGEYYLRAYMTTEDDGVVPYMLGGMELVSDQPVGVYGALASAKKLQVTPADAPYMQTTTEPVHIYLDKLFKRPGSEPDTKAHVRVRFSINENIVIPDGRQILIRLHKSSDLDLTPVYQFSMASELFLVQGRLGQAEYVTPSLEPGSYVVFAYLDSDGNGFFDEGEASSVHKVDNVVTALLVEKDRTQTIALDLASDLAGSSDQ